MVRCFHVGDSFVEVRGGLNVRLCTTRRYGHDKCLPYSDDKGHKLAKRRIQGDYIIFDITQFTNNHSKTIRYPENVY